MDARSDPAASDFALPIPPETNKQKDKTYAKKQCQKKRGGGVEEHSARTPVKTT